MDSSLKFDSRLEAWGYGERASSCWGRRGVFCAVAYTARRGAAPEDQFLVTVSDAVGRCWIVLCRDLPAYMAFLRNEALPIASAALLQDASIEQTDVDHEPSKGKLVVLKK